MFILLKDDVVVGTASDAIDEQHLQSEGLTQIESATGNIGDVFVNGNLLTLGQYQKLEEGKIVYDVAQHRAKVADDMRLTRRAAILDIYPNEAVAAKIGDKYRELSELLESSDTEEDINSVSTMLSELMITE